MNKLTKLAWVLILLLGSVSPACSLDKNEPEYMNVIGGGAYVRQSAYEGIDVQVWPVPVAKWRNERFFVDGLTGGMILQEDDITRVDFVVGPRLMGFDADNSNALEGMENRNMSMDAGLQITCAVEKLENVNLIVNLLSDALNENKGQEGSIKLAAKYEGSFFQLIPSLGVVWQSKDMVNYYYGVRDSEVSASRPAYKANHTLNYVASLGFNMGLSRTRDIFLVTRLDATFLGDEIKKSSIVNKDMTIGGLLSVVFKF